MNYRHADRTRYFAELVRRSRTSIADETREEHRRRVPGGISETVATSLRENQPTSADLAFPTKPLGFPLGSNSRIVISALASLRRDSNIAAVERFISKSHTRAIDSSGAPNCAKCCHHRCHFEILSRSVIREISHKPLNCIGGPGRTRTSNQAVMSRWL